MGGLARERSRSRYNVAMMERVQRFLLDRGILPGSRTVLLGVSGGTDSLTALHVLHELGAPLICAHFDHGLRPESQADAAFVQAAAAALDIPCVVGRGDVQAFREARRLSIEEAARTLRYQFLFEQARRHQAAAVFTAHTADDQVETVLMHFLRGAGGTGLKGMCAWSILPEFDPLLPLARPFLQIWRREMEDFAAVRGLTALEDASNRDPAFFRNRIRHDLLPALEAFNPRIREIVLRTAQTLALDEDALDAVVDEVWARTVQGEAAEWVCLDVRHLRDELPGVQGRLVRRAVGRLRPGLRDVDYETVQRALALLSGARASAACDLVAGLQVLREYDRAWVTADPAALPVDAWPQLLAAEELPLSAPGEVALMGGWRLALSDPGSAPVGQDPLEFSFFIDPAHLSGPLALRGRLPGDRFRPEGLTTGRVRLSDYMINEKIPKRARAHWPLVVSGDEIVWVVGRRGAEGLRAAPGASGGLLLQLSRG